MLMSKNVNNDVSKVSPIGLELVCSGGKYGEIFSNANNF